MSQINVQNLDVTIENKKILNKLNLQIKQGSVHALMGPNGSGKSTLAYTLLGHPSCNVTDGAIYFDETDITDLSVEKRARLGLFLAFQYPHTIPGLNVFSFLKEIYASFTGKKITVQEFKEILDNLLEKLKFDKNFLERGVNEGFSGGEKKRFEVLQLMLLKPKVAIIDEIDSGLDIDALKLVANAISECKKNDPEFTVILVTHYQRILKYIEPDFVHIFYEGKVIKSGNYELSNQLEEKGYDEFIDSYQKSQLQI